MRRRTDNPPGPGQIQTPPLPSRHPPHIVSLYTDYQHERTPVAETAAVLGVVTVTGGS
ncbi:hypothetical protein GCM10010244_83880 [Streptomyces coeruleorubidus]|nr:hypothetical protein GCM10010244_83880 [Streptomyces bellus]